MATTHRGNLLNEIRDKNGRFVKGFRHTEESKAKIKKNNRRYWLGKTHSWETRAKLHAANIGKKLSRETRIRIGLAERGEKHHNWQGGITPLNNLIRESIEYKEWRTAVFERDNYACTWCGVRSGNGKTVRLEADHIKAFAFYPKLRFDLSNGRTLCKECHFKTDTHGRRSRKEMTYVSAA